MPFNPGAALRLDHHHGDGQQQDSHILHEVIVIAGDGPGDGHHQEKGDYDRSCAAQGRQAHRLDAPTFQHEPLAGKDGQGGLGIRRAEEYGGNGVKERLGDAGGQNDGGHLKRRQSLGQELRRKG